MGRPEQEREERDAARRDVVVLVENDVIAGLRPRFPDTDDEAPGFALTEPFGASTPINNDTVEVVVWTWTGRDTAGFQGNEPSGDVIIVRGVTLVEHPERGEEATFHRYVDWSEVAGQLGLGFTGRPTVDVLRDA